MRRAIKKTTRVSATNSSGKKTSVGKKNISFSTMNKSKRRSIGNKKLNRGQGK